MGWGGAFVRGYECPFTLRPISSRMCYKILLRLRFNDFFVFSPLSTRGHPYKLQVNHAPANVRRNFFAGRVVKSWNSLPTDTTDFGSLCRFRDSLHRIDFTSFLMVD